MVPRRDFRIVDVSDHVPVRLGREIRSAVDNLARWLRTTRKRVAQQVTERRAVTNAAVTNAAETWRQPGVRLCARCAGNS